MSRSVDQISASTNGERGSGGNVLESVEREKGKGQLNASLQIMVQ